MILSARQSRTWLVGALAAAAQLLTAPGPVHADAYPAKPVRIIVNSTPGGLTDIVARVVSTQMAQISGQTFVVENRPGSVVGIDVVAKSPADGYTVGLFASALSALPALVPHLPFDPATDLTAIALVSTAPLVLTTGRNSPYRSVAEYIADAKARPGQVSYASGGSGTMGHLLAEQMQASAGVSLIHVPYKGGAPATADVMAGHVPVFLDTIGSAAPLVRSGRLRALAIVSKTRSAALPDVPTLAEAGVANVEGGAWYGMFGPRNTPPEIVAKLNEWVDKALHAPEVVNKLTSLGTVAEGGPPGVMNDLLMAEMPRWTQLVRERNIKAD
jgi:tripartite-type tricarboxylate transporter receptor subunit TctC